VICLSSGKFDGRWKRGGLRVAVIARANGGSGRHQSRCRPPPDERTCSEAVGISVSCQQATSITDGGSVSGDRKLKESTLRVARGRPQPSAVGFGGGFCLPAWPTAPGLAQPFACREPIDRRTWCTLAVAVALRAMRVPMMHVRIILVIVVRDVGYGG
jgi:hypothetical protein